MEKEAETQQAVPPKGDTGSEEEKTFTQTEVDALLAPEVEKRKDAERASTKHSERVKGLEASQADIQSLRQEMTENMQLLAGLAAEGRSPESAGELEPDERGAYIKKAQAQIAANAAKREQVEYNRKADEQWARVQKLGLTPEDDTYDDILDLLERGKLDRATRKIDKLEPKTKEPDEKRPLTEEQEEEIARKVAERKGSLATDTGGPSGGGKKGLTVEDVKKMSPEEQVARSDEIAKLPLSL